MGSRPWPARKVLALATLLVARATPAPDDTTRGLIVDLAARGGS